MRLRRQRARNEISIEVDFLASVASAESSPTDRLTLEQALAGLPDELRAVFVLKEIEGYSHREIGELMGIQPGTSKIRLHRARRELQRSIEGTA